MMSNGIMGLPSSPLVYVTAGFFISSTNLSFLLISITGTIGNVLGNILLYEVSRKRGLSYVTRWKGFSQEKIIGLERAFQYRGPIIIFIGKFLPIIKVIVPIIAGIASMNRVLFIAIISLTSFLWALGLVWFGFCFGKNSNNGRIGWYSFLLTIFAIIAIYVFSRYIQRICEKKITIE